MLLIIHNLPSNTHYADVKALIQEQCGISELIVDNLVSEGKNQRVTIGLADESDGVLVMSKINGLFVAGQQLFVENAKPKRVSSVFPPENAQPTVSHQYDPAQYNQFAPPVVPQYDNSMYYQPHSEKPQFYSPMVPMDPSQPQLPLTNYGVPYYMSNQNPNIGNTQQFNQQVQYPQVQGPTSSDPYGGQNYEMDRGHESRDGSRKDRHGSRSRSPNRGQPRRERKTSTSRWNEPESKGSGRDGWPRGSDQSSTRDRDRYNDEPSYNDRSHQDSHQGRSERNYGSNKHGNDRFQKNHNRSEPNWDSSKHDGGSSFGRHNESSDSNDRRKFDTTRQYNQVREPQDFREDQHSQSRNSANLTRRANDYNQKRPYDAPDKNKFAPTNKKFGTNQQYDSKRYPEASGSQYTKKRTGNPQYSKTNYNNKSNQKPVQPMPLNQNNFKPPFKKGPAPVQNPSNVPKHFSVKWEGWLNQASAIIAKEILRNVRAEHLNVKRHPVILKLRAFVRTRIDVITGYENNERTMKLDDIILMYRDKFSENDDPLFYETVLKKVDKSEIEEFNAAQEARITARESATLERLKQEPIPAEPVAKQFIPKYKIPKSKIEPPTPKPKPVQQTVQAPVKVAPVTQRLPKYPGENKKTQLEMKKAKKEDITNDTQYSLDGLRERILKEELTKIYNVCNAELENPQDEMEKSVGKFMSDVVLAKLQKVTGNLVRKRLLDVRTNLAVRVYCSPRCPKRPALDAFLRNYGATSLKKCDTTKKKYIVTCDTFENFDALCKLNSTKIESKTVQFRPLHTIKQRSKSKKGNKQKDDTNMDEYCDEIDDGDEGTSDQDIVDEDEDDVIMIPDHVSASDAGKWNNGESKQECTNENSDDVVEVKHDTNNSADTIVIEDDNGEADVAVDEVKTEKVTIVNDKPAINDEESQIVNDKPAINDDDSQIVNDKPAINDDDSQIVNDKPAINDDDSQIVNDKPAIYDDKSHIGNDEPTINDDDCQIVNDEPAINNDDSQIVNDEPAINDDKSQNVEPEAVAAIEIVEDDLEDF